MGISVGGRNCEETQTKRVSVNMYYARIWNSFGRLPISEVFASTQTYPLDGYPRIVRAAWLQPEINGSY